MIEPNFDLMGGLIPAVIQNYETNEVLMVGYMNLEAWQLTLHEGRVYYYSRKKKRIWLKGEQSGNYQIVKQVLLNCDNTCLLIKAEQIGGACDQGLMSCFDKILDGKVFESAGVKVFDPQTAYGENYTQELILGIPSGSLEKITFQLLNQAGLNIRRISDRSYHPIVDDEEANINLFMARAQELPFLVAKGSLDVAITGIDMVEEDSISIKDVCDLGYNKLGLGNVSLVLAIPEERTIKSLKDLDGMRIATAYPNFAQRFFRERGLSVQIVPSMGATEGKVPLIADAIIDLVESGNTLKSNGLKPIYQLLDTSVHLISSNATWGYTWKRRRIEDLGKRLKTAAKELPQNPKEHIAIPLLAFN